MNPAIPFTCATSPLHLDLDPACDLLGDALGTAPVEGEREAWLRTAAESALRDAGRLLADNQVEGALFAVFVAGGAADLLGGLAAAHAANAAAAAIERDDLDGALCWLARACVELAVRSVAIEARSGAAGAASARLQADADPDGAWQIHGRHARTEFGQELVGQPSVH